MFASTATPTAVYHSRPDGYVAESFTHGTGATRLFRIRRVRLDNRRQVATGSGARRSKNPDQVVDLLAAFFESGSW
jgi:hypothetical protein